MAWELDKAAQTYQEMIASYPRTTKAYSNLSLVYAAQGQYQKAAEVARQALRLDPDHIADYDNLANYALALQRSMKRGRSSAKRRRENWMSSYYTALSMRLHFWGPAMAEQQQWYAGKPEEDSGLALASDTEAYGGHLSKARELTERAVDSAIRADSKENGAMFQAIAAQREAAFGDAAPPHGRGNSSLCPTTSRSYSYSGSHRARIARPSSTWRTLQTYLYL